MTRAHRWITLPVALMAAGTSPTSRIESVAQTTVIGRPNVVTSISGVVHWRANQRYVLRGPVVVSAGGTLVIDPGTRIEGQVGTSLVVARDARIIADGTLLQPIVMSCTATTKFPGCWDGVVINGYAPVNAGTATSPAARGGSGDAGCLEITDAHGPFGGCETSDSSGVLRYVRVEYATDGIQLRGLGNKTRFDFVEVLRTWGDGVSIAGGSIALKHAIISASGDAGLAWRNGWVGRGQFLIIQQDPANFRSAIRGENDATSPDATPRSAPQLFNSTILAASSLTNPNDALPPRAIWLRNGTGAILRNLIVHRARVGVDIDGAATCGQLSGGILVANNAFTGATQLGDTDVDPVECAPFMSPSVEQQIIETPANANLILTTQTLIDSVFFDGASLVLPDLRLRFGRPVSSGVNLAPPPADGFFDTSALYYGAISPSAQPASIPWYSGWTIGAPLSAPAPNGTITGIVSQLGGSPLAGISISSQGTSVVTDPGGAFSLSVPSGYVTLSVTGFPPGCAAVAPTQIVVRPSETVTHNIVLDCNPPPHVIAAGGQHTCFVMSGLWCWGDNTSGAVGDGSTIERSAPTRITSAPTLTQVAAGIQHSCGLTALGAAWCWGQNATGQLGDGSTTDRLTPTLVAGSNAFIRVAAGNSHTCGLTTAHLAFCWGNGGSGQLGAGPGVTASSTPVAVSGGLTFRELVAGGDHTCGLATDGKAYCWGANTNGELGTGTTASQNVPTAVVGDLIFTDLGAGTSHTCGVRPAADIYCWGSNGSGQLGDGGTATRLSPARVVGSTTYKQVEAGNSHTCGLTLTGDARCWGSNAIGQIGDGTLFDRLVPTQILSGVTFYEIDIGGDHTCGLTTSSEVACWGSDAHGQVGQSGGGFRRVPTTVAGGLTFATVSSGVEHSCGLTAAGAGFCWGRNTEGQLGDGTLTNRNAPTPIAGGLTFSKISSGSSHTCAINLVGAAYCWGMGILGNGASASFSNIPVLVAGELTFTDISVGQTHTCARASDGGGYCWGLNAHGQLGNGSTTERLVPTRVAGIVIVGNEIVIVNPNFSMLSAGAFHTCGVASGNALCWGRNDAGQLGNGTTSPANLPTQISGALTLSTIDAGQQHTCAIATNGQAWCWGSDAFGQLGDGTPGGTSTTPNFVQNVSVFSRITAGGTHTCGSTVTNVSLCWGNNQASQLGDGTVDQRNAPTTVAGGNVYSALSAGQAHTCGATSGTTKCWGSNSSGQIGDGLAPYASTPVIVWNAMQSSLLRRR